MGCTGTRKLNNLINKLFKYFQRMFTLRYTTSQFFKSQLCGSLVKLRTYHLQQCARCSEKIKIPSNLPFGAISEQQSRNFSKVTDNIGTELYFEVKGIWGEHKSSKNIQYSMYIFSSMM